MSASSTYLYPSTNYFALNKHISRVHMKQWFLFNDWLGCVGVSRLRDFHIKPFVYGSLSICL